MRGRRVLLRVLHSALARVGLHPVVVLALYLGGLYAFYLSPAYALAQSQPALHGAAHLHMFAAGHDVLAELLYAHTLPRGGGAVDEIHRPVRS